LGSDTTRAAAAAALALATGLLHASPASAQIQEPIGRYVVDARITWARFKEDPAIAAAIGVTPTNLPTRGLGFVFGGHWYPLRGARVAVGLGGEFAVARDTRAQDPVSDDDEPGPTVETRFASVSPQLSLNFGRKDGWSYISGGMGSATFTAQRIDLAVGEATRARTINYGGGARWFTKKHLAVSVDLRFYSVSAQPATPTRPAYPKSKMMVISGGIALR
jgi:hypothetical protein